MLLALASPVLAQSKLVPLFGDTPPSYPATIKPQRVDLKEVTKEGWTSYQWDIPQGAQWAGMQIFAKEQPWDFSRLFGIRMTVSSAAANKKSESFSVKLIFEEGKPLTFSHQFAPGASREIFVPFRRSLPPELSDQLYGMRGYPGGYLNNWRSRDAKPFTQVKEITLFLGGTTEQPCKFSVARIAQVPHNTPRGVQKMLASPKDLKKNGFFPFIDPFGQYKYSDWPGKTKSVADMKATYVAESKQLAATPRPASFSKFGGWKNGPQQKGTGRFRTIKKDGKWWFVDPEGYLFFSHGLCCVRTTSADTPIGDREHYFENLPPNEGATSQFYGKKSGAPNGYYADKKNYATFNFGAYNLSRKYGDDWEKKAAVMAHKRLAAWGINTIANWSEPSIYRLHKTPHTVNVWVQSRMIEGSKGHWRKFPDPFDPKFATSLRATMEHLKKEGNAATPWVLGYFIHNELGWGSTTSLAEAVLTSSASQPAKVVFRKMLEKKYKTVTALNKVWGTDYSSWENLLVSTKPVSKEKAKADLLNFYTLLAEKYFRTCREGVKAVDPQGLYLGCRFSNSNPLAVAAAAKYCDVVSFNKYDTTPRLAKLPEGFDKPVVIGEFHCGALDRGMLHTGLVAVPDQDARAAAYKHYVFAALDNPLIVGTHWFVYSSQATTGRWDGENYQIGFVDMCDTPYNETVNAARQVGEKLYTRRSQGKK